MKLLSANASKDLREVYRKLPAIEKNIVEIIKSYEKNQVKKSFFTFYQKSPEVKVLESTTVVASTPQTQAKQQVHETKPIRQEKPNFFERIMGFFSKPK